MPSSKLLQPPLAPRKFYFLEYFYIILKSIESSSQKDSIFSQFLSLKNQHRLGESRYKKITEDSKASSRQIDRYRYTFEQVLTEAENYNLVSNSGINIFLTNQGYRAIEIYESKGYIDFNQHIFPSMEEFYQYPFRYLVEKTYEANPDKSGLLIFPIYSAHRLGIERSSIQSSGDMKDYFQHLQKRLEEDIEKHLSSTRNLSEVAKELVRKLIEDGFLSKNNSQLFEPKKYNAILKRGRDYWLKFFLQELYQYKLSLNSFDIWAYRAKQIGLLHITEFYPDPNFSGRVVYPLSVIRSSTKSPSFKEIYTYREDNKRLFLHQPVWKENHTQEGFVKSLHDAYLDVRQFARTYFVSLPNVRERVCYSMKIPEYLFDIFLENAYHDKRLNIRISLEVDKLPEESNAMYLRREPVMIGEKYRNIIAIDLV